MKDKLLLHVKYLVGCAIDASPTAYAFRKNCLEQAIKDIKEQMELDRKNEERRI